mmetsp:Transcript_25303/g.81205  ORF Transcript_25303/g.81205 Transcript_25303/m.81205 type:complete len:128 (-) Transcript_25303:150-533(-)
MIDDAVLLEAVAKQGGYEEVENEQAWGAIAKVLGQRKTDASKLKQRYEEMLLATADAEKEDEDEEAQIIGREHEVEDILDDRIEAGEKQYLVKWRDEPGEFEDASTWEPVDNLGAAAAWSHGTRHRR